jgi:DMSO/TMAO reductase YedYZ molybdopterin-dependent catalytic subunit
MHGPEKTEAALAKAASGKPLTDAEIAEIRSVLDGWRMWKAWGRLGKLVLWAVITLGAVAAAIREVRGAGWFGG